MGAKGRLIARVKPGKRFFADFFEAASAGSRIGNLSAACKRVSKKQAEKNNRVIFLPTRRSEYVPLPDTCIFGVWSALSQVWAGSTKIFSGMHFSSSTRKRRMN
jgi:hypothetical protein